MITGDMKAIALNNPGNFHITFAGIGFKDNQNKYVLVVFKGKRVIFEREYKNLETAKRGFTNFFKNDEGIKPAWTDFAYCYSYRKKKKGDK